MKTCEDQNPITLAVNIPADGLFLAILNKANGDFSKENCNFHTILRKTYS